MAQVAADEPDTAAKMPQPTTFTCMSRPGSHCSQGERPRNISSESLVRNRISPIQMNSGSAASVHEALSAQTVVASTEPIGTLADEQHRDKADGEERDRDPDAAREQQRSGGEQQEREPDEAEVRQHRLDAPLSIDARDDLLGRGRRLGFS